MNGLERPPGRHPVIGAVAITVAGGLGVWQAAGIRRPRAYEALGPEVLPLMVCTALTALGVALLIRITVTPDRPWLRHCAVVSADGAGRSPLALLATLVVYALALGHAGWVLATTAFVPGAARLLGSRRPGRDALTGAAVALGSYLVFTRLLHLELPGGWLSGISGS